MSVEVITLFSLVPITKVPFPLLFILTKDKLSITFKSLLLSNDPIDPLTVKFIPVTIILLVFVKKTKSLLNLPKFFQN